MTILTSVQRVFHQVEKGTRISTFHQLRLLFGRVSTTIIKDRIPFPSSDLCVGSVKEYQQRTVTVRDSKRKNYETLKKVCESEGMVKFLARHTGQGDEGTVLQGARRG